MKTLAIIDVYKYCHEFNKKYKGICPLKLLDYITDRYKNIDEETDADRAGLSKRSIEVLYMRQVKGMTLSETASELGLSRERIRQIEAKAMRRMSHLSNRRKWDTQLNRIMTVLEMEIDRLNTEIKVLIRTIERLRHKVGVLENYIVSHGLPLPGNDGSGVPVDAGIDTLNLSVRAYNALRKAGIDTVGQLLGMSEEQLMSIKGFGRKCLEEVVEKLAFWGYEIPHTQTGVGDGQP